MAAATEVSGLSELLKPFHARAALAEERLAKLEACLKAKEVEAKEQETSMDFKEVLKEKEAEHCLEKEQLHKEIEKRDAEIAKLQYRILHLSRAVGEADEKLEKTSNVVNTG